MTKSPHLFARCVGNEKLRAYWDGRAKGKPPIPRRRKLGNIIARWLAWFGITKRRIKAITGGCKCRARQRALNKISI